MAERLSKIPPLLLSLGKIEIGPVMDAQTHAKQKAIMATMNITKTVADLLDNVTTSQIN